MYTNSKSLSPFRFVTHEVGCMKNDLSVTFVVARQKKKKSHEWANEWLNGCTYLLVVNDLTKATKGCCFLKTADRKRNKNRFFFIYILKILKSSKALSVNIHLFCVFINHSYQYPMSLRLISILPYLLFILFQAPPPPPCTFWPAVINQEYVQTTLNWYMKTWMLCEQCYIFFCL